MTAHPTATRHLVALLRTLAADKGDPHGRVSVAPATLIAAADRLDLLSELLRLRQEGERIDAALEERK